MGLCLGSEAALPSTECTTQMKETVSWMKKDPLPTRAELAGLLEGLCWQGRGNAQPSGAGDPVDTMGSCWKAGEPRERPEKLMNPPAQ